MLTSGGNVRHDPGRGSGRLTGDYDSLDTGLIPTDVIVRTATAAELALIHQRCQERVDFTLTRLSVVERMRVFRDDQIWSVRIGREAQLAGFYSMVMLSAKGEQALLDNQFDPQDPDMAHVAEPGSAVAAIYKWMVFAPGRAAASILVIASKLREPAYRTADLYATGSTLAGRRVMTNLGFQEISQRPGGPLFRYKRK